MTNITIHQFITPVESNRKPLEITLPCYVRQSDKSLHGSAEYLRIKGYNFNGTKLKADRVSIWNDTASVHLDTVTDKTLKEDAEIISAEVFISAIDQALTTCENLIQSVMQEASPAVPDGQPNPSN